MFTIVLAPSRLSQTIRFGLISLLVGLGAVSVSGLPEPAPVSAGSTHFCECVEFVKSRFGLSGAAGNAKDMGAFLAKHGFRRSDTPAAGGVVIFQPGAYKSGDGAIFGHVGVIESTAPAAPNGWFVGVRGANQTGTRFADQGCSDVTFKSYGPFPRGSSLVSYWLPPHK